MMFDFLRKIRSEANLKIDGSEISYRAFYDSFINENDRLVKIIVGKIDDINSEFYKVHNDYLFINNARAVNGCCKKPDNEAQIKNNIVSLWCLIHESLNRNFLRSYYLGRGRSRNCSRRKLLYFFIIQHTSLIGRIYDNIHKICFLRHGITCHTSEIKLRENAQEIIDDLLYKSKPPKTIDEMKDQDYMNLWIELLHLANDALTDIHKVY